MGPFSCDVSECVILLADDAGLIVPNDMLNVPALAVDVGQVFPENTVNNPRNPINSDGPNNPSYHSNPNHPNYPKPQTSSFT